MKTTRKTDFYNYTTLYRLAHNTIYTIYDTVSTIYTYIGIHYIHHYILLQRPTTSDTCTDTTVVTTVTSITTAVTTIAKTVTTVATTDTTISITTAATPQ